MSFLACSGTSTFVPYKSILVKVLEQAQMATLGSGKRDIGSTTNSTDRIQDQFSTASFYNFFKWNEIRFRIHCEQQRLQLLLQSAG